LEASYKYFQQRALANKTYGRRLNERSEAIAQMVNF
jgi:hypothetical protein